MAPAETYIFTKSIPSEFVDISPEKDGGIMKYITKGAKADTNPCKNDDVVVSYVGTYWGGEEDGKEFDSNSNFNFKLGVGDVIKSWDCCVASMKIGESCELITSPDYAYEDGKAMHFKIELFASSGQDVSAEKDGSVRKSIVVEGEGFINPIIGTQAKVSYKDLKGGNDAPETIKEYIIGDPEPAQVPNEIDQAVRAMTADEIARVQFKECEYAVKLLSFEKIRHLNSIESFPKQMDYADEIKEKGNAYLKAGKYKLAVEIYNRVIQDLLYLVTNGSEEKKQLDSVQIAILNNTALAHLKSNETERCLEVLGKVLEIDFKNEKALYRRGQVYLSLKDHEEALVQFKKCLFYYKHNTDALKQVKFCEDQVSKAKLVEKQRFRGIFNRLKETGLGLPDEPMDTTPEKHEHEHGGCDSCSDGEGSNDLEKA